MGGALGGRGSTGQGAVDIGLVGTALCAAPGWGVVGQSEVGLGDTLVPQSADRALIARVGYCYVNRHYEVT